MELDGISCLSLENQVTDFPVHYHETYCISLIHKGIERLDLEGQTHYGEAGSITVTRPFEIHSQPVISTDLRPGFDTIYLSEDLMKFYMQTQDQVHLSRKINDHRTSQNLINLRDAIHLQEETEVALQAFISSLKPYASTLVSRKDESAAFSPWLVEVKDFVECNITTKISLNELAAIANLNKFGFSKVFKTYTGMSPMNYVLMQKVFSAKRSISQDSNLTFIAYKYDFSDLSHFSNTFKRFVGVSPLQYRNNLR